jgi:hypothetical protein
MYDIKKYLTKIFLFPAEQILTDLVLLFESIGNLLVSSLTKLISKECIRSYRSYREISIYLARIVMRCRLFNMSLFWISVIFY